MAEDMVEIEQTSSADDRQPKPQENEIIEACKITPNFEHSYDKCFLCELEHDSPEFGPYCSLCHDFLYPNVLLLHERKLESVNLVTVDSSSNLLASERCELNVISGVVALKTEDSGCESENEKTSDLQRNSTNSESAVVPGYKLPYLSLYERVRAPDLVAQRLANELRFVEEDLFETLPPEILLMIFSFLDDISLCMVGQVCQWWHQLAGEQDQWKKHVLTRWPSLFQPADKPSTSWQNLYIKMLQGVTCRRCFEQGCVQHSPEDDIVNSWRNKRLKSELKGLLTDPPEGIRARPLDSTLSYWQASIKGPPDCPYEEGLFFLHLEIPKSYPMRPPIAKFITRVFHPNVSYHGDIGIDALRHNWSLALTIPKVLVSIRSLLTDPYCQISMEPEIASFCESDREGFNAVAREWTKKYAKLHLTS